MTGQNSAKPLKRFVLVASALSGFVYGKPVATVPSGLPNVKYPHSNNASGSGFTPVPSKGSDVQYGRDTAPTGPSNATEAGSGCHTSIPWQRGETWMVVGIILGVLVPGFAGLTIYGLCRKTAENAAETSDLAELAAHVRANGGQLQPVSNSAALEVNSRNLPPDAIVAGQLGDLLRGVSQSGGSQRQPRSRSNGSIDRRAGRSQSTGPQDKQGEQDKIGTSISKKK